MSRHLIVNADDFGQAPGINAGVVRAHERGIVTSVSLMVRGEAVEDAAAYAAAHPQLSVGLHIDLGEWVHRDGEWHPAYVVVDADDEDAVQTEVGRQLDAFERLLGRPPTHLDSHQHVHRPQPVRRVAAAVGRRLGVPVRHLTPGIEYRGDFYGQTGKGEAYPQAITVDALVALLRALPDGWTELGCHPGRNVPTLTYGVERARELAALCDPAVAAVLEGEGIALRSFHDMHDIAVREDRTASTGGRT